MDSGKNLNYDFFLVITLFLKISGSPPIHDKCSLSGKSKKKTPHLYCNTSASHFGLSSVADGQNFC